MEIARAWIVSYGDCSITSAVFILLVVCVPIPLPRRIYSNTQPDVYDESVMVMYFILLTMFFSIKAKPIVKTQKIMNKAYERGYGDFYNAVYNVHVVKSSVAENFEKKRKAFLSLNNLTLIAVSKWLEKDLYKSFFKLRFIWKYY